MKVKNGNEIAVGLMVRIDPTNGAQRYEVALDGNEDLTIGDSLGGDGIRVFLTGNKVDDVNIVFVGRDDVKPSNDSMNIRASLFCGQPIYGDVVMIGLRLDAENGSFQSLPNEMYDYLCGY